MVKVIILFWSVILRYLVLFDNKKLDFLTL